jgi:FkbM family methyltransferase
MKTIEMPGGDRFFGLDKLTAEFVYKEIYEDDVYFKEGIDLNSGDTVLDIGANIGLFTRMISKRWENLKVFTFEPVPAIHKALLANLENVRAEVVHLNTALGAFTGQLTFCFFPKVSADSAIVPVEFKRKIQMFNEHFDDTMAKFIPSTKRIPRFLRPLPAGTSSKMDVPK